MRWRPGEKSTYPAHHNRCAAGGAPARHEPSRAEPGTGAGSNHTNPLLLEPRLTTRSAAPAEAPGAGRPSVRGPPPQGPQCGRTALRPSDQAVSRPGHPLRQARPDLSSRPAHPRRRDVAPTMRRHAQDLDSFGARNAVVPCADVMSHVADDERAELGAQQAAPAPTSTCPAGRGRKGRPAGRRTRLGLGYPDSRGQCRNAGKLGSGSMSWR